MRYRGILGDCRAWVLEAIPGWRRSRACRLLPDTGRDGHGVLGFLWFDRCKNGTCPNLASHPGLRFFWAKVNPLLPWRQVGGNNFQSTKESRDDLLTLLASPGSYRRAERPGALEKDSALRSRMTDDAGRPTPTVSNTNTGNNGHQGGQD
jgi:hypothetical protein